MTFEPRLPRDDVNVSPTHPLVEAGWLLGAVFIAGVLLAVLAFGVTEIVSRWLPPDLEVRLFRGVFDAVADDVPAEEVPRQAAARELLLRLAARWPENPYALRLYVAAPADPNAFALPGGVVMLTRGLLEQVESENELAFVLAHELGHFAARDHLRTLGRGLILALLLQASAGVGASDAVPRLASDLASRGFARDQERHADAFALELIAAEYGHAGGADRFFRRLPDAEAVFGDRAAVWFASHPLTEARIRALREHALREQIPMDGPLRPFESPAEELEARP